MQELRARLTAISSPLPSGLTYRLAVYIALLGTGASGIAIALAMTERRLGSPVVVVGLVLASVLAERGSVRLGSRESTRGEGIYGSVSILPMVFAAVLWGAAPAMLVGAASWLGGFGRPYLKWLVYTLSGAVTGALAGFVATAGSGLVHNEIGSIAICTAITGTSAEILSVAFACTTVAARGKSMTPVAKTLAPVALSSVPLYVPLVALLAVAYREVSPWTLPLFLVPALAAQRLFILYHDQRTLAEDLATANEQLERANLSFATALVTTLDARDRYTAGHSAAVAIYARDIAQRLGLPEETQQLAHQCGLVHDIGKIGLPAGLLEKPGALTLEERRQMQEHSAIGERILAKVEDYAEIATIVRHHHERMDGMGYPDGIAGEEIPLLSRIIAVADAYNAMTSDRPYRDAMPSRVARMRLAQGVEGQFDTTIVAAFEAVLAGATEEYRSGTGLEFTLDAQDLYSGRQAEQAA
jgi:putative nucleotidyltransferase with HDIG domain